MFSISLSALFLVVGVVYLVAGQPTVDKSETCSGESDSNSQQLLEQLLTLVKSMAAEQQSLKGQVQSVAATQQQQQAELVKIADCCNATRQQTLSSKS
jgi:hypothetical protein